MTVVYYKTADGGFRRYHKVPPEMIGGLEDGVRKFNESMKGKEECHVVEFEDGSFEAEIFNRACEVNDAMDTLEDLSDALGYAIERLTAITALFR